MSSAGIIRIFPMDQIPAYYFLKDHIISMEYTSADNFPRTISVEYIHRTISVDNFQWRISHFVIHLWI